MSFDEKHPLDYFRNAQINFENLMKVSPFLASHPIFALAKEQLDNGIKLLEEKIDRELDIDV